MVGDGARGFCAGSELERMLEKDMGSAERLGVLVEAAAGFGVEGAACSVLTRDGSPELPFVVALILAALLACLAEGEVMRLCRVGGLMEPAGFGCECDNGLRGRL
jgi:hypothetical protein